MNGIAVSTRSACSRGASGPSHVPKAIGLTCDEAYSCLRFSFGASPLVGGNRLYDLPCANFGNPRALPCSLGKVIVSPYRIAIDRTTDTIDRRARYFRNLIVAVVMVGLGSLGWTVVSRNFSPLAGLLLLLPLCGLFFFLDAELLDNWRSHLLEAWVKKDIDFQAFCDAVNAVPKLPKETLGSMLATLPSAPDLVAEQRVSSSTREGVAAAVAGSHASQSDAVALKAAAAAIVSGAVIVALASRSWEPLSGGLATLLLPILGKWLKRRRIEAVKKRTSTARAKPDFSNEKYEEQVSFLRDGASFPPTRQPWNQIQ
jgi:hypothetical protein